MSARVTATVVCCILMQILCVLSQKSFSFWGTSYRGSAPDPAGGLPSPRPSVFLCPPNNPVRSTPLCGAHSGEWAQHFSNVSCYSSYLINWSIDCLTDKSTDWLISITQWQLSVLTKDANTCIWLFENMLYFERTCQDAVNVIDSVLQKLTSGSAMAEGPRDALVSRNSATTKHPTRQATCAF